MSSRRSSRRTVRSHLVKHENSTDTSSGDRDEVGDTTNDEKATNHWSSADVFFFRPHKGKNHPRLDYLVLSKAWYNSLISYRFIASRTKFRILSHRPQDPQEVGAYHERLHVFWRGPYPRLRSAQPAHGRSLYSEHEWETAHGMPPANAHQHRCPWILLMRKRKSCWWTFLLTRSCTVLPSYLSYRCSHSRTDWVLRASLSIPDRVRDLWSLTDCRCFVPLWKHPHR